MGSDSVVVVDPSGKLPDDRFPVRQIGAVDVVALDRVHERDPGLYAPQPPAIPIAPLQPRQFPLHSYTLPELPRNALGKVQKHPLESHFSDGPGASASPRGE